MGLSKQAKRAELVLLDADPLADIRNTQRINAVITGGRLYRRPSLDKMLEFAEADARSQQRTPLPLADLFNRHHYRWPSG